MSSCSFPTTSRGRVYHSCVRSAMLHASETWAPTLSDLHPPQRNDRVMIRWMCRVTTKDQVSPQDLLKRMQLDDLANVPRTRWRRWHGQVERSEGGLKKVQKLNPTVRGRGHGRPRKPGQKWLTDHLALGLRPTHPTGKLEVVDLEKLHLPWANVITSTKLRPTNPEWGKCNYIWPITLTKCNYIYRISNHMT